MTATPIHFYRLKTAKIIAVLEDARMVDSMFLLEFKGKLIFIDLGLSGTWQQINLLFVRTRFHVHQLMIVLQLILMEM